MRKETNMIQNDVSDDVEIVTKVCSNCGNEGDDYSYFNLNDDDIACDECAMLCERCDEATLLDNTSTVTISGGTDCTWCEECTDFNAFYCNHCSNTYDDSVHGSYEYDGDSICTYCFQDHYFVCYTCDTVRRDFDVCNCDDDIHCNDGDCCTYYDEDDEDYNSRRHRDRAIHDYGYKPEPVFVSKALTSASGYVMTNYGGNKLYFGMELEVEGVDESYHRDDLARIVIDNCEYIYNKHDGSLSSNGFEIVCDPILSTEFNDLYPYAILDTLRSDYGVRSWDTRTCGIHIHMSKAAFTTAHMYKFLKFMYSNQHAVQRFAGRQTHYADFSGQSERAMDLAKGKAHTEHFNAVNVTRNTLEVRVFKGTLNVKRIKSNVEFLNAVYDYTQALTVKDVVEGRLVWNAFTDYVKANSEKYPTLAERKEIQQASAFVVLQDYKFKVNLEAVQAEILSSISDDIYEREV